MPTLESIVTVDPEVMSGTPVFAGTRAPVKNLLDYPAAGDPLERFLDHFPSVRREQAVAALEIAADLLRALRVLLDESLPRPLGRLLVGHPVQDCWSGGLGQLQERRVAQTGTAVAPREQVRVST